MTGPQKLRWQWKKSPFFLLKEIYLHSWLQIPLPCYLEDHPRTCKYLRRPPFIEPCMSMNGKGTTGSLGHLRSTWLLTTYKSWDDPPTTLQETNISHPSQHFWADDFLVFPFGGICFLVPWRVDATHVFWGEKSKLMLKSVTIFFAI